MTIGLSGFAVAAVGCFYGGRCIYRNRKARRMEAAGLSQKVEEGVSQSASFETPVVPVVVETVEHVEDVERVEEVEPVEEINEINEAEEAEEAEEAKEVEEVQSTEADDVYHPWWTGVDEISLYLNKEQVEVLDSQFPALCKHK